MQGIEHCIHLGEDEAYGGVWRTRDLLDQAHQQDLRPGVGPVVLQMLLGLRANIVVCGLESLEELRQLGVDLRRKKGHLSAVSF